METPMRAYCEKEGCLSTIDTSPRSGGTLNTNFDPFACLEYNERLAKEGTVPITLDICPHLKAAMLAALNRQG
jgi:hypothetical protein